MKKTNKKLKILSCGVFTLLYLIVSVISLICSTSFFNLAHSGIMSWVLAIGFELGAMSCLLSTLILPKNKLGLVWFMFVVLTLFQCMGNMYAAYINLENYTDWIAMFGMDEMEPIAQKRVLAAISGIILPLVALGFIRIMANILQDGKSLEINDYEEETETPSMFGQTSANEAKTDQESNVEEKKPVEEKEPAVENNSEPKTELKKIESREPEKQETIIEKTESKKVETFEAETKQESVKEEINEKNEPEKQIEKNEDVKKSTGRIWDSHLNAEVG